MVCTLYNLLELFLPLPHVLGWLSPWLIPPSCSFLVNGRPTDATSKGSPSRRSLFPLIVLCAEGLEAMITKPYYSNKIHGLSIARGDPIISHLFSADDSLIFARANVREAGVIRDILQRYDLISHGENDQW